MEVCCWYFLNCVVISFRPNLFLSVSLKSDTSFDLRSQMTKQGNQFNFDGPTIIYCPTKKATNEVAAIVKGIATNKHWWICTCFEKKIVLCTDIFCLLV